MSNANTGFVFKKKEISIFFSYSHQDEQYRDQLEKHLGFLKKTKKLATWHDRKIVPGDEWAGKIDEKLNIADIILLLISPDFADSSYCWDVETKRALERQERGEALVVPIIIRPVEGWEDTPIGKLQALPLNANPVSMWGNQDAAYQNIAQGIRDAINSRQNETASSEPNWIYWCLILDGQLEDYPQNQINAISVQLRKAANSVKIEFIKSSKGSVELKFRSTQSVFETLKALYNDGKLQQKINASIKNIKSDIGAVLHIESRTVNKEFKSTIHYLPEIFGGRSLEEGFLPLVGGVAFPLKNPMQIGFSLLTDSSLELPTLEEQAELQGRLGRYLNTFLVLTGDQVNVTLTPTDNYCGLSELLRHTELGRDMLAQDVVLKHYTASQLHPSTAHGRAFWDEVDMIVGNRQNFESCFRVWIVPDGASVRERTEKDNGHVTIEKLGLKVLCEEEYGTLQRFRVLQGKSGVAPVTTQHEKQIVDLFKKLIVPEIQREVSTGPRFALLRQILSVLLVAKWIMGSQLGDALKQSGFLGSNCPEKYGLNRVEDNVINSMRELYLQLFGDGVWQCTRNHIDIENNVVEKRLYIAGGIELN